MKVFFDLFQEIVSNYSSKLTISADIDTPISEFCDVIRFLGEIDREVCYYLFNLKMMKHEYLSQTSLFFQDANDLSFNSYFDSVHPSDQMLYAAILNESFSLNSRFSVEERKNTLLEYTLRLKMSDNRYVYVDESLRTLVYDDNGEGVVIVGMIRLSRQNKFKPPFFYNFEKKTYIPIFEHDSKYNALLGVVEELNSKELSLIRVLIKYPKLNQRQIADLLDLHNNTIKNYIKNIKRKMGTVSLEDVITMSYILGLGYGDPDVSVFTKE